MYCRKSELCFFGNFFSVICEKTAVFDSVATRSVKLRKQFVTFLKSLSAGFGYDTIQNIPTFDVKLGDVQNPEYTLAEIFGYL
jgi:hypothetical protein